MFTANPYAPLTAFVPPAVMQGYVVLMVIVVALGTLFDLLHEKKIRFFVQERARAKATARRHLGAGEMAAIAARTLASDIATFGEFCNRRRRISHALMFYGFVAYLVTSAALLFAYPTDLHPPALLPLLWSIGVLMNLAGAGWFFFFLRVNVVHDGHSRWRPVRADLFIVTLLASVTGALLLAIAGMTENQAAILACSGIYVFFTTLLCISVPWSKFPHMFYKPVVAFQRRLEEADGSSSLPARTGGERCPLSHT